jgi:hypothetical protein
MRYLAYMAAALVPLGAAWGAELATTETPVGRLALPVVPDSLVVSPDSSRLALAAKSGDPTLEEKGVFINPKPTNPLNDSARPVLNPICLYIDDKPTIPFDSSTVPVFSPDSRRLGYAGRHDKTWQFVLDGKTLTADAEDVPAAPLAFSPDSEHAGWAIQKDAQYQITEDDRRWPPLAASTIGMLAFSPDSRHLATVAHVRAGWMMFVDGTALGVPPVPPRAAVGRATGATTAGSQPAVPAARLERFGQFAWRPDSIGVVYYAAFVGSSWQFFAQALNGTITYTSTPYDAILKGSPVFSPDGRQMAFGVGTRNKWAMMTEPALATATASAPSPVLPFDQVLAESVAYYRPEGAADRPYTLVYLAQQNKKWHLYADDRAQGDAYDAIIQGSFVVSPDRRHYAFAGNRDGQTVVIRDGTALATHSECAAFSFAFSPDSRHLAYAGRNSLNWFACVDGKPGASFSMMTNSPIAFSPDSSRVAYLAMTAQKMWRVIVGQDGQWESKPYDSFLKGASVKWHADGTVVTIAIQKKVAMRVEAKP